MRMTMMKGSGSCTLGVVAVTCLATSAPIRQVLCAAARGVQFWKFDEFCLVVAEL
jgi:hypothetical protein